MNHPKHYRRVALGIAICFLTGISSCTDEAARIHASTTDSSATTNMHADHKNSQSASNYVAQVNSGAIKEDTMKGSPHMIAMANVGTTHVHITYSSPGVKGRVIWGGLVAYDKVWVAGAHQATHINFNKDVTIADKSIPAGDYAFFAIPGKDKWILILNKNFEQHLADDYKASEDIVRVEATPITNAQPAPRLVYTIEKKSNTAGEIVLKWENVSVAMPFTTK